MKKQKHSLEIGERYEIKWFDTFSFNGWWDDDDLMEKTKKMTYLQRSVGIFAGQDKNWIILVTHENPHEDFVRWGHPDWIPKGVIQSIKKI